MWPYLFIYLWVYWAETIKPNCVTCRKKEYDWFNVQGHWMSTRPKSRTFPSSPHVETSIYFTRPDSYSCTPNTLNTMKIQKFFGSLGLWATFQYFSDCLYVYSKPPQRLILTGLGWNVSRTSKRPWGNFATCIYLNSCCWMVTVTGTAWHRSSYYSFRGEKHMFWVILTVDFSNKDCFNLLET